MKILCLSTYPVDQPRHGGQHRLSNIIAVLRNAGHDVYSAGVLGSPSYPPSRYFVPYPGNEVLGKLIANPSLMEDWAVGALFQNNRAYFESLAKLIPVKPDLIYCEQPWMFGFAQQFNKKACRGKAILIYGSANVESTLKKGIVNYHFGAKAADECAEMVRIVELNATQNAEQTFCVSEHDMAWTTEHAPTPPILAPNGVIDRVAGLDDIAKANEITNGAKFALYCASAHPPNIDGFFDIFGFGVGCFPPAAKMVVAGGAGGHILNDFKFAKLASRRDFYVDAGEVTEQVLRGLLATAHQIVLPITHGGGTNLKSAEAIWSGCHVVATTKAMRGFEQFSGDDGISVADEPAAFCKAVRDTFLRPNLALTPANREKRKVVLWEHCLSDFVQAINEIGART